MSNMSYKHTIFICHIFIYLYVIYLYVIIYIYDIFICQYGTNNYYYVRLFTQ